MRSEVRGVICAGICSLVFPSGSQATIITFFFDAEVTQIGQVNSFGGLSIGDTFSGSLNDTLICRPGPLNCLGAILLKGVFVCVDVAVIFLSNPKSNASGVGSVNIH